MPFLNTQKINWSEEPFEFLFRSSIIFNSTISITVIRCHKSLLVCVDTVEKYDIIVKVLRDVFKIKIEVDVVYNDIIIKDPRDISDFYEFLQLCGDKLMDNGRSSRYLIHEDALGFLWS